MAIDSSYKHSELTDAIIGVFYDVLVRSHKFAGCCWTTLEST
jgi:hypothetical protein